MKTIEHYKGLAGEGWKMEAEPHDIKDPANTATLSSWLIFAPGQTPAWSHYIVFGFHLRDIPGAKPAMKRDPRATHEVMILALNPDMGPGITVENFTDRQDLCRAKGTGWFLKPANLAKQFEGTDEELIKLTDLLAKRVVEGALPAEPPLSGGDYWTPYLQHTLLEMRSGPVRVPEKGSIGGTKGPTSGDGLA